MTELEKNAEELAYKWWHSVDKEFVDVIDAYVQGYKDAVDKFCEFMQSCEGYVVSGEKCNYENFMKFLNVQTQNLEEQQ